MLLFSGLTTIKLEEKNLATLGSRIFIATHITPTIFSILLQMFTECKYNVSVSSNWGFNDRVMYILNRFHTLWVLLPSNSMEINVTASHNAQHKSLLVSRERTVSPFDKQTKNSVVINVRHSAIEFNTVRPEY